MKIKAFLAAQVLTNFAYAGQKEIDQIREDNNVPALAAAIVSDDDTVTYVSGVRKWSDRTPATVNDKFHLGSDTKAMTATLMAIFVERGLLRWDETYHREVFRKLIACPRFINILHKQFAR